MKCAYHTKWCDKLHRGGSNHLINKVVIILHCRLSHHLVWYAHFLFYSVQSTFTHCKTPSMSFITPFSVVCTLHFLQCTIHIYSL